MPHAYRCFGAAPGGGNPALVIEGHDSDADVRQRYAHTRRTTCVFVDAGADGVPVLDYFYPHARSPLCLHATLAVASLLLGRAGNDTGASAGTDPESGTAPLAVRTAQRGQLLLLSRRDGHYFVALEAQPAGAGAATAIDADGAAALLNAPAAALVSAPVVASVGSPKLLLQMADSAALRALRPDLAAITAWSKEAGVNGCYAWCELGNGDVEGRNFNHLDPVMEDSATGVAAGALSVHLGRGLRLFQGAALGQPCLIVTRREDGRVLVGGAVEVDRGKPAGQAVVAVEADRGKPAG
jgi:PhzF family phenazine biosynthesis protein